MATAGATPRRSVWGAVIGAGASVLLSTLGALAQTPDVVLDIVTSPQRDWIDEAVSHVDDVIQVGASALAFRRRA